MARKRKTKTKRVSFKLGSGKKKKKRTSLFSLSSLMSILKVLAVVCVFAAVGVGFIFLGKYVQKVVPVSQQTALLELVNVPAWVNEPLKEKIMSAATAHGENLKLDEDVARSVQNNLADEAIWLDDVKVQATDDRLLIEAKWRKPLALVRIGAKKFYVDANQVVLDFVEMPNLPIVEAKGLSTTKLPKAGQTWLIDDLAAAIAILKQLDKMDAFVTPEKPLLYEIDRIDVRNFNGRKSDRRPHVVLYTKDNTKIIWGAEVGTWQRHLEASDAEKLGKLYHHYEEYGSLMNNVKYINLCTPQDTIPLPVDKY